MLRVFKAEAIDLEATMTSFRGGESSKSSKVFEFCPLHVAKIQQLVNAKNHVLFLNNNKLIKIYRREWLTGSISSGIGNILVFCGLTGDNSPRILIIVIYQFIEPIEEVTRDCTYYESCWRSRPVIGC